MMNETDPILEATLHEVLGGKTPPDLVAQTLARAQGAQHSPAEKQPVAGPRPAWRAWGTGLAAAAVVAIIATVGMIAATSGRNGTEFAGVTQVAGDRKAEAPKSNPLDDVTAGNEDNAGGQLDDLPQITTFNTDVHTKDIVQQELHQELSKLKNFNATGSNPFVDTEDDPLSTFALEHDTGSYTIARDYLNNGQLPPDEAVRVEEFINYFDYGYFKPPVDPFNISMDIAPSRYGRDLHNCYLMRVGVQARQIRAAARKPAVLTFVIDISGSMDEAGRLPLVKQALSQLVNQLSDGDQVGIAVFGTHGRRYMDYQDASHEAQILAAIDKLQTEGSTNAEEGLKVGYEMANAAYREGCTNRVILCSDGVANVGKTQADEILKTIVANRRKGITLSTIGFGFGPGNYNDTFMEQLGDKGDGHYAYVDNLDEAKRTFTDNLTGALEVVGRDVKIQLAFDPQVVKSYRLLGYVNRDVADKDFRNDKVDGGEIGAGYAATALYEVKLYDNAAGRIAKGTLRYKQDENDEPQEITNQLYTNDIAQDWRSAGNGLRLAGDVAEFGEILGNSFYAKQGKLQAVLDDLEDIQYAFRSDQVAELIKLVKNANELQ